MPVTGSPDPPEPPISFKTPAELQQISEDIVAEDQIPSWEWTAYIYGTILPHIEELHRNDQLIEYTYKE